ncbi:MAG: M23 family metallopeptidase [Ruminococcaceae bacterium]|nr:M23 family metallopeptidase [Oscillospiraceae bacterium]
MKKRATGKEVKRKERPPFNLRLICAVFLLIVGIFIKIYPAGFNKTLNVIFKTDCDYGRLFAEVGQVVKCHTMGNRILSLPVQGEITSPFGLRQRPDGEGEEEHTGMDISVPENTPVHSAGEGRVIRVEENEFYGKFVMIEHTPSIVTLYGHLNSQSVKPGDSVSKETVIGLSGSTGRSTGPHLHFEVRNEKKCVNPGEYLL